MLTDEDLDRMSVHAKDVRINWRDDDFVVENAVHTEQLIAELRDLRMIVSDAIGSSETLALVRRRTLEEVLEMARNTKAINVWAILPAIEKLLKETT